MCPVSWETVVASVFLVIMGHLLVHFLGQCRAVQHGHGCGIWGPPERFAAQTFIKDVHLAKAYLHALRKAFDAAIALVAGLLGVLQGREARQGLCVLRLEIHRAASPSQVCATNVMAASAPMTVASCSCKLLMLSMRALMKSWRATPEAKPVSAF